MRWTIPAALLLSVLVTPARAQESAAPFDAPLVTLSAFDRYAFLADLDQDGFMDAVSWWWANATRTQVRLKGWRNDRTGRFVEVWSVIVVVREGTGNSAYSVRVLPCHLDADGNTDLCVVFSTWGEATIRALRSRGLAHPELASEYSVTVTGFAEYRSLHGVLTDFTGDGVADVAYSLGDTLRLLEQVPGTGLQLRSETIPFGGALAVGGLMQLDADGDATPDLLAWRGDTIQMIEVEDCLPVATHSFTQGILDSHMPAQGDVDGDGDADLVIWDMSRYVVARRTGAAGWSIEPPVTGGPAEFLIDVDQDGDLDGVCCGGGGSSIPQNISTSILRVSINDGSGAFAPALETPWLGSDHLAGVADLDHDGDLDIVSGRCVLYARGSLAESLHPPLGALQSQRSTADIDGDSDPDFTVGLRTIERNRGEGLCSPLTPSFPAAPPGTELVGPGWPGDFDGDGDVDLVVELRAGSTFLAQRLLVNLGGGAFADAGDCGPSGLDFLLGPGSNEPQASLAGDVDGDGDVDLITLHSASSTSFVWWNDGAGQFTAGPELADEVVQWIGDLSGDGIPDLVGALPDYYLHAGWSEGLGGGVFAAPVQLQRIDSTRSRFAVADLDSDGDLDLALAYSNLLHVHWNEGAGLFTREWLTSVSLSYSSSYPHHVWSTDLGADGRMDLLVTQTERERNGVIVLRRKSDGSGWEAPFAQIVFPQGQVGTAPAFLRDVDGDGDEDLVTDRLIRNATHTPPLCGWRRQAENGTPGAGGLVPTLGAEGPFRVGESAELRLRGGLGGAQGLLTVTLVRGGERGPLGHGWINPTNEPILAQVPLVLSGPAGVAGAGSWTFPYTVGAHFGAQTRRYVVELLDPAAPGGIARSNTMVITYGP
ncbi:MAG TPA: VCBS repeat-containing protein [Planctomycetota bacterium]